MAWFNASQLPKPAWWRLFPKMKTSSFICSPMAAFTGGGRDQEDSFLWYRRLQGSYGDWHHVAVVYSKRTASKNLCGWGRKGSKTYANETLVKTRTHFISVQIWTFHPGIFKGWSTKCGYLLSAWVSPRWTSIKTLLGLVTAAPWEVSKSLRTTTVLHAQAPAHWCRWKPCVMMESRSKTTIPVPSTCPPHRLMATQWPAFIFRLPGAQQSVPIRSMERKKGFTDLYLYHNNENDVLVNVEDSLASVTSLSTDPTGYRTTGLVVTTPGNLSCGTTGKVVIQAIGQNPGNTGCGVLEGFSGDKSLKAWFTAATDPGSGADDPLQPLADGGFQWGIHALSVQTKPGPTICRSNLWTAKRSRRWSMRMAQIYMWQDQSLSFEYATAPSDGVTLPIINSSGSTPFVFYPVGSRTLVTERIRIALRRVRVAVPSNRPGIALSRRWSLCAVI